MPGSIINDLDQNSVGLNAGSDAEQFRLVRWEAFHRIERIVDEIGPNLVQRAAIGADARQVLSKLTRYLNAMLELVLEHAQRHVDTLFDIDFGDGALVHVGIGLNGLHEIGNAARGFFQLTGEAEDLVVGDEDAESKREDFSWRRVKRGVGCCSAVTWHRRARRPARREAFGLRASRPDRIRGQPAPGRPLLRAWWRIR